MTLFSSFFKLLLFSVLFNGILTVFSDEIVPVAERGQVVINEFVPFSSSSGDQPSLLELYSLWALGPLDVSGYILQFIPGEDADGRQGRFFTLPEGSVIAPHGLLAFSVPAELVPADGGRLLFLTPAAEIDDCHEHQLDQLTFAPHADAMVGMAYARCPDGSLWLEAVTPSAGLSNDPSLCDGTLASSSSSPSLGDDSTTLAPTWKQGNFEIHMFDMGQADSALVIFPSGYTLLIDAGEAGNWNSMAGAKGIAAKLVQILGHKKLDAAVVSHQHLDHLGYVLYGGFYGLLEREGVSIGKLVDRDAGVWEDRNKDGKCDENTEIVWRNAGTVSGTSRKWICYATNSSSRMYAIRETAQLCSTAQIRPPDQDAFVKIVTVDAIGATLKDGKTRINQDLTHLAVPPSENDYSVGLLIGMGSFRFATFGDLDGEYATSSYGYTYNHIEAVVAPRVGPVDVYRVNHHGSGHSSSTALVNTMKPRVSLFSCGVGNSYGHPVQEVLDRLAPFGDIFLTSDCDTTRRYPNGSVRANGNLVLRSTDRGKTYTVFDDASANNYKSYTSTNKQPAQPPCP